MVHLVHLNIECQWSIWEICGSNALIFLQSAVKQDRRRLVNAIRTVGHCGGSEVKNDINTVQFLAQTDRFVSLDLNVSSLAAGFNLVLSVYVFFYSQSRGSHWLPLYDWQTATVWVKNLCLCSTEETKSPTSWMPWGKQINITFSFLGELSL